VYDTHRYVNLLCIILDEVWEPRRWIYSAHRDGRGEWLQHFEIPPKQETITGVASLEFSEKENIQSSVFGRKVHGDSFMRPGKSPAAGNHEKGNHNSSPNVREYAQKAQLTDVLCPTAKADGRGSAAEWQSQVARQSTNDGGDHKTEVGSIAPPTAQSGSGTCSINWKTAFVDDDSLVASAQKWLKSADTGFRGQCIHIHTYSEVS
jgi:hypothetical protein